MFDVSEACAKYFHIDEKKLYGRGVDRTTSLARHLLWYVLHVDYGIPTSFLSKNFYRTRRHIFFGINKIREGMKKQRFYKRLYDDFKNEIGHNY